MFIAVSTQNVVVIIVITVAVVMLARQIYRVATGKITKCSCCSDVCSTGDKKDEQCTANDEEQKLSEENSKKPE
jgi:hypothetical protein